MNTVGSGRLVAIDSIIVPEKYSRRADKVEDDKLLQSIQRSGIQQPLVVSQIDNDSFVLVDGYRRLEVARFLNLDQLPCVVDVVPDGVSPEDYRDRLRFILDEHRQDLTPGQRAKLIQTLKNNHHMNNRQVGEYLGVDMTTVANWLLVGKFIPEVVDAIDANEVTQHAARALAGMTEEGQKQVWAEQREQFRTQPGGKLHRVVREHYHPTKYPHFYVRPEKVAQDLNRPKRKRVAAARPVISKDEKESVLNDVALRESELKAARTELEVYGADIEACIPVVRSIVQTEELLASVPLEAREDLLKFAEIYV